MPKAILFIEDEPTLQKTFEDLFRHEGYAVIQAMDGEQGLRFAKEKKPDLIMLDLILPRMDGFEVLKELKANDDTRGIPVIILTNLEGTHDVEKAIGLGATTYLVKANYALHEVLGKVRQIIGNA